MRLFKRNNAVSVIERNITLVADGWTLIGHSSDTNVSLADVKFTNSSGTEFTWAEAIANNTVQAYLAYYDSSSATASQRKFKYVAISGVDDTKLTKDKGYWLYSNEAGNLTLPSVGGSYSNESYVWRKLRFVNSSGSEKNISEAGSANWVETTLQYWGWDPLMPPAGGYDFLTICSSGCDKSTLSPWEGVFVKSLKDNITFIRQN